MVLLLSQLLIKIDHKGNLQPVTLNDVSFYETSLTDVPAPGTKLPKNGIR